MTRVAIWIACGAYLVAALGFTRQRNWNMALVWFAYAFANFCLGRIR